MFCSFSRSLQRFYERSLLLAVEPVPVRNENLNDTSHSNFPTAKRVVVRTKQRHASTVYPMKILLSLTLLTSLTPLERSVRWR